MAAGSGGRRRSADGTHRHSNENLLSPDLLTLLSTITTNTSNFLAQNDINLLPSQTLTLETLIASTSNSLSVLASSTPFPIHHPPNDCWYHRLLTESNSDDDPRWTDSFRMSKRSFNILLKLLTPSINSMFQSLPANYILAAAIYRLANGAGYNTVGRRFGMDAEEACRAFFVVCKSVHVTLGNLFELRSDMERIAQGFLWMGLPNCCGVLGMEKFKVGSKAFGENGGVMLQAVVDSEGRFVDVSAGWPISMGFGTVLRHTKLYVSVEECRLLDGGYCALSDGMSVSQYLLGESGFPLLPWLLTPYNEEDSFGLKEKAFNAAHARGIELVRTAFAKVKGRWRLLTRQWKEESVEFLPFVIVTGCLLHNFLIKCNDYFPDEENVVRSANADIFSGGEEIESAHRIRDTLASHFSLLSMRP